MEINRIMQDCSKGYERVASGNGRDCESKPKKLENDVRREKASDQSDLRSHSSLALDHSHVNIRLYVKYGGVRPVCMETKALPGTTGVEPLVKRLSLPTPWEHRDSLARARRFLPTATLFANSVSTRLFGLYSTAVKLV